MSDARQRSENRRCGAGGCCWSASVSPLPPVEMPWSAGRRLSVAGTGRKRKRNFLSAVREKPRSAAALKWLGMVYTAQEKFELAEAPFRERLRNRSARRACLLLPGARRLRAEPLRGVAQRIRNGASLPAGLHPHPARAGADTGGLGPRAGSGAVFEGSRGGKRQGRAIRLWPVPVPPGATQGERCRARTLRRSGEPGKGGARSRRASGRGLRPTPPRRRSGSPPAN